MPITDDGLLQLRKTDPEVTGVTVHQRTCVHLVAKRAPTPATSRSAM